MKSAYKSWQSKYWFVTNLSLFSDPLVKKDDVNLFLETDESYFAHDISTLITNDELADMISYWQELEEYERCSELIKLMKVI